MTERNADRIAFRFQLGAADPQIVPCVGLHPDLVPHALAVHAREIDVKIGKSGPRSVVLVVAELPADGADLAVFFLDGFNEIADVDQEFTIQMRAAGAVPAEQIMPRSGRRLGGRARGDVLHRNVVDRDRNLVLVAPFLGEVVEPFVVFRDEVTPLHNRQRLGVGHRARHEWRREHRCRAGSGKGEARVPQESAPRDRRRFVRAHLGLLLCLVSVG